MKKLGLCLLAFCLVGYVAGCGTEDEPTVPNNTPPIDSPDTGTEETETPDADPPA